MDTANMNKIEFIPKYKFFEKVFPKPTPVQSEIPGWWKDQESYLNNDQNVHNGTMLLTVKKCQAVFDSMSFGYYLKCPMDISIDATGSKLVVQITNDMLGAQQHIISNHLKEQILKYPIPDYFHEDVLRIHPMWLVKTEEGYSSLFISPMHGDKSPIKAIPGIIDTDKYPSDGFFSFFVEKGFKGIIKQGTPISQVIPFKREEWESSINKDRTSDLKNQASQLSVRSVFQNGYRLKFWSKKTFK
jgi:hypothetical protein